MNKIEPKILKGTRDFSPLDMAKRNLVMNKIRKIFQKFGYDQIETPIICPAETILGKYGEEGDRLTYNFPSRGGAQIALPFDLTVPFARFFAANWRELPLPFKRYQIQRVWRAEKPQKGRLREFYQCDIDIIGTKSLVAEAEIALVVTKVFEDFGFKNFKIKVNSRRLLNEILKSLGIREEEIIEVIRIIDKLDKIGEEGVIEELNKLNIKNIKEILKLLKPEKDDKQTLNKFKMFNLKEMTEFLNNCKTLGIPEKYIQFDPSLARGLDYYTGITYEVVVEDGGIGTLCAGGRYDNLCGLYCDEDFSGVGVAFGFERMMIVLEEMGYFKDIKLNSKVLITVFDDKTISQSLDIYTKLINEGINCEIYFEPEKLKKQFKYADKKRIPFVIIQGPDELKEESITVKNMKSGEQNKISMKNIRDYFDNLLAR